MEPRAMWIAGAVISLATLGAGTGIAVSSGAVELDDDKPLTGSTLEKATKAALDHTGGGTVTETESGDDGAAYGVEVLLDDGRQVEVNLDKSFKVTGQEIDDDSSDRPDDD